MIPRALLFGNPAHGTTSISPDGRWLAWAASRDGVMNLWASPRDKRSEARQLTFSTRRGVSGHSWTRDSAYLLFSQDNDGDENHRLYGVNVADGVPRCFSPEGGARMGVVRVSRRRPETVLVDFNRRDPRHADLYLLDLASGELTLALENPGFAGFIVDDDYVVHYAIGPTPQGGRQLSACDAEGTWNVVSVVSPEDARTTGWSHIDAQGQTLYGIDSRGRDTGALVATDIASGAMTVLAQSDKADVGGLLIDLETHEPLGCWIDWDLPRLFVLSEAIRDDVDFLASHGLGRWSLLSRTSDDRIWLIGASSDTKPGTTYLYDRDRRALDVLVEHRPELAAMGLAPMHPVVLTARDGLDLVCYVTLPLSAGGSSELKATQPSPLVLFVHGGPWDRDQFGFYPMHQWLADRGYAVMGVNFRGSTGFGKAFINAADGQWGRKMSDDLDDAVDWAIASGLADPLKLAIVGGSYGGFAVLSALIRDPKRYACAIDIFGPSNLESLLQAIPPQWEHERQMLYRAVGNPTTPEGIAALREVSPLHAASRILTPLLVAQGSNDPRVRQVESDQMVEQLVLRGIPVTYLVFPDEGHGFVRESNRLAFNAAMEAFLGQYLGGGVEPFTLADFTGTSLQVREGSIAGLQIDTTTAN